MSLILRVGWVCTLEKYVTKFYVTNWEGRVGLNPNMYDVTLFSLFFLKASLNHSIPQFKLDLEAALSYSLLLSIIISK